MHDSIRYRMHNSLSDNQFRTLFLTADAVDTLSADAGLSIRHRMQETLYETGDAWNTLLDSECRSQYIRQRLQDSLHHTTHAENTLQIADGGVSLSDSGFRRQSITQRMQDYIRQHIQETVLAKEQMQESLYQTMDTGDILSDSRSGDTLWYIGFRSFSVW